MTSLRKQFSRIAASGVVEYTASWTLRMICWYGHSEQIQLERQIKCGLDASCFLYMSLDDECRYQTHVAQIALLVH
jgi:hypothetical protein